MNTVIFDYSGIWPQMTQFDLDVLKPSNHPKLISNEQIGIRKSLKNGHVWPVNCAKISIFQVDFLEILNNFWTRYENFDKFVDLKEPECNLNMFFIDKSGFFRNFNVTSLLSNLEKYEEQQKQVQVQFFPAYLG